MFIVWLTGKCRRTNSSTSTCAVAPKWLVSLCTTPMSNLKTFASKGPTGRQPKPVSWTLSCFPVPIPVTLWYRSLCTFRHALRTNAGAGSGRQNVGTVRGHLPLLGQSAWAGRKGWLPKGPGRPVCSQHRRSPGRYPRSWFRNGSSARKPISRFPLFQVPVLLSSSKTRRRKPSCTEASPRTSSFLTWRSLKAIWRPMEQDIWLEMR